MAVQMQPLVLNGSHGEGGGALLRTALAMSALTQQPVRIHTVRGAMRKPGVNSEDLAFVRALETVVAARVEGDELGSDDLSFVPTRSPRGINQRLDIGAFEKGLVPGSALIVAEALMPVLARAGSYSSLVVHGETYTGNALTFDAFLYVTLAAHRAQGLYAYATLESAGFGFGAHGEVTVEVEPSVLQPLDWSQRGKLRAARALVVTADLPEEVAQRGVTRLEEVMRQHGLEPDVEAVSVRSRQPGAFVTVWAEFERGAGCGTCLGQKGTRMERVADAAFENFLDWYRTDATVDAYLADQLLLPAAMAEGRTVYKTPRVTRRLVTMAWVVKQFLPIRITILGVEGEPGTVTVER